MSRYRVRYSEPRWAPWGRELHRPAVGEARDSRVCPETRVHGVVLFNESDDGGARPSGQLR
ncbi:hypothetical protein [Arthrobacter tecti]